ncbi:MAG: N-acetylmuramoyl-L-alanine amidase, partial [Oscillospiraceae bacterium]|nr:N-acetylmuramoyl-L-alanine amidase [Oscillospiraceae bacterium]
MKYPFYIRKFWCLYLLVGMIAIAVTVGADRAVTTIAENTPIEREQIIVIDAGHGGEDGGAVSCSGALESHINLQIALRLNDLLHLLGYETIMIRSTDISVYTEGSTIAARKVSDLKQRVRTVNQTKNAILISIHQNTFPDGKYSGAQVFYNQNVSAKELAERMQQTFVSHLNIGSN